MEVVKGVSKRFVDSRTHTLALDNKLKGLDLVSFELSFVPDGLEHVEFSMGGSVNIRFWPHELHGPVSLPLLLSKCPYVTVRFELTFSEAWLAARDRVTWVDGVGEEVEMSDTEEEFYDDETGGFARGRRVRRRTVPTKVRHSEGVEVQLPDVTFVTVAPDTPFDISRAAAAPRVTQPYWQPVRVTQGMDEERLKRFGVTPVDGRTLEAALREGTPFQARVKNCIYYQGGLVGSMFVDLAHGDRRRRGFNPS